MQYMAAAALVFLAIVNIYAAKVPMSSNKRRSLAMFNLVAFLGSALSVYHLTFNVTQSTIEDSFVEGCQSPESPLYQLDHYVVNANKVLCSKWCPCVGAY